MKTINDIQTSIILDKIPNTFLYRNNWLNSKNKELKLYSIFKFKLTNGNTMVIYLGTTIKNNTLCHVFYQFDVLNNNKLILYDVIFVINLNWFLSKYTQIIDNYNSLFNDFIKAVLKEEYKYEKY